MFPDLFPPPQTSIPPSHPSCVPIPLSTLTHLPTLPRPSSTCPHDTNLPTPGFHARCSYGASPAGTCYASRPPPEAHRFSHQPRWPKSPRGAPHRVLHVPLCHFTSLAPFLVSTHPSPSLHNLECAAPTNALPGTLPHIPHTLPPHPLTPKCPALTTALFQGLQGVHLVPCQLGHAGGLPRYSPVMPTNKPNATLPHLLHLCDPLLNLPHL